MPSRNSTLTLFTFYANSMPSKIIAKWCFYCSAIKVVLD